MERAHIELPPPAIDLHSLAWRSPEVDVAVNALVSSISVLISEDSSMTNNVRTLLRAIWNADTTFITDAATPEIAKNNFNVKRQILINVLKNRVEDAFWYGLRRSNSDISDANLKLLIADTTPQLLRHMKQIENKVRHESNIYIIEELVNTGLVDQDKILPLLVHSKLTTWSNKMTIPRSKLWLDTLAKKPESKSKKIAEKNTMADIKSMENSLEVSDADDVPEVEPDVPVETPLMDVDRFIDEFVVDITQKMMESIKERFDPEEALDWSSIDEDEDFLRSILTCDIVEKFRSGPKRSRALMNDNEYEPQTKKRVVDQTP